MTKRALTLLFIVLAVSSFLWHFSNRLVHYQELDSDTVWASLNHFDEQFKNYRNWSYPKENLWHLDWRAEIVGHLDFVPSALSGFYQLPYTTTYSPGMGLLYSIINSFGSDYHTFMERGVVLNLLLFHMGAVFLFFSLLNGFGVSSAFLGAVLFLFSISHYSYGYHLGSVNAFVWTGCVWLWSISRVSEKKALLLTAFLSLFSYLTVFLLGAQTVAVFLKHRGRNWRGLLPPVMIAWTVLILVFFFFFSLESTKKGRNSNFAEVLDSFYYIILNCFAWFRAELTLQFLLAVSLVVLGLPLLWKRRNETTTASVFTFFVMVAGAIGIQKIGFVASRHMLFMSPVLFYVLTAGLERVLGHSPRSAAVFGAILLILGPIALQTRSVEVVDQLQTVSVKSDVVLVYGSRVLPIGFKSQDHAALKRAEIYRGLDLETGKVYLYLSQEWPSQNWLRETSQKLNKKLEVIQWKDSPSDVYFTAFNSRLLAYSRSNAIYYALFRVLPDPQLAP